MSKQKIIAISAVVVAIISAFLMGCFVGCNLCAKHKGFKKPTDIKFYEVKKNIGKQIANDEKQAIKIFVDNFEKCLNEKLEDGEKNDLNAIQNEVLEIAKENHKIKVRIVDLKNKNASVVVKKVRRCAGFSKKHMTKTDKRLMRGGLSKMKIEDIIKLFHGIR